MRTGLFRCEATAPDGTILVRKRSKHQYSHALIEKKAGAWILRGMSRSANGAHQLYRDNPTVKRMVVPVRAIEITVKTRTEWVVLCKRTNDPKLAWLCRTLSAAGIANKIEGRSFHAPLLWVKKQDEDRAWAILDPIDDVEDDDPQFLATVFGKTCERCGSLKHVGESCACFDNHCE